jgi:hypothetical protein
LPDGARAEDLLGLVLLVELLLQVQVFGLQAVPQLLHLGQRVAQRTLGLHALQLGAAPRRKDLEHGQLFGRRFERLRVEDCEVPDDAALRRLHRHADITVDADLLEP